MLHNILPLVPCGKSQTDHFSHFGRLLRQRATKELVSPDLWRQITALGWQPVLRDLPHITFRPTGGVRVPARSLGGGPGTLWVGANAAFARGHEEPWLLLTNTPPAETDVDLYACRPRRLKPTPRSTVRHHPPRPRHPAARQSLPARTRRSAAAPAIRAQPAIPT